MRTGPVATDTVATWPADQPRGRGRGVVKGALVHCALVESPAVTSKRLTEDGFGHGANLEQRAVAAAVLDGRPGLQTPDPDHLECKIDHLGAGDPLAVGPCDEAFESLDRGGGGEMNRETSSVVNSANSDDASDARSSRSRTSPEASAGRPFRQSLDTV